MFDPVAALKQFYANAKHIMSVSYKPSMDEFKRTLKIVLIGTIVLGIFGYLVSLIIGFLTH